MVDKDHVRQQVLNHFNLTGTLDIDDEGRANVNGNATLVATVTQLPVTFGAVTGSFNCANRGLTTLMGAPREVGQVFDCKFNRLTTLESGPLKVGSYNSIGNPLTNLNGLATAIKDHVQFSYDRSLPLLRTLVARLIWPYPDQIKLEAILNKYAGQGQSAALACAAELADAGFKANAQW